MTHTEFKSLVVSATDGTKGNAGNVFTREFLDRHKAFFDYKNAVSIRDGDWVVTL